MANKSKRFNDGTSDNPGPGAYTLSKKADWIRDKNGLSSAPGRMQHASVSQ